MNSDHLGKRGIRKRLREGFEGNTGPGLMITNNDLATLMIRHVMFHDVPRASELERVANTLGISFD